MKDEEEKEIRIKLRTLILILIIIILLLIMGGLYWYDYHVKDNNNDVNDVTQNALNETNEATNTNVVLNTIDTTAAYANYKNILWTQTTGITYPAGDVNGFSAWVDNLGMIYVSYPGDEGQRKEIQVNSLSEKGKYITIIGQVQSLGGESLLVLTEDNNLYVVSEFYTVEGVLTDSPLAEKFASDILEIYKDEQIYNGTLGIPTALTDGGGGTFTGIYALTIEGKLLSINSAYNPDTGKTQYVLGLSYEECNAVKGTVFMDSNTLQITSDNYLREASDVQANYILDSDNNKMVVRYIFVGNDGTDNDVVYVVTADNRIYYVGVDGMGNYYPGKLLNDKIVKSIVDGRTTVTITYTNDTTERFIHRVNWESYGAGNSKYGF